MDLTRLLAALLVVAASTSASAAVQGPPRKPWLSLPGDRDKSRQTTVTASPAKYEIVMDAPVDGVMTRLPIGYQAFQQTWEPNRRVRLENVGDTDVVNPWLIVNGKRRWRTVQEIAAQAIVGCTTDRDKARAIWEFTRHHRFHATTWDRECVDAAKVFNVYGYTLCGNDAQVITDLWKAAGLKVRRGFPIGHCVAEAFYDGEFHLLDGDEHCIFLRRDNRTIASEAEVVRDHHLIKRTHTYGILRPDSPQTDEFSASLYIYEGERKGEHGGGSKHTMAYVLRPGEAMEWRWSHVGKQYTAGTALGGKKWKRNGQGDLTAWGGHAYGHLRNGMMEYRPDLNSPVARQGLHSSANLAPTGNGLRAQAIGKPCHATWEIASPYVVVGAQVELRARRATARDGIEVSLSRDGKQWQALWTAAKTGLIEQTVALDEHLSPRRKPQYKYYLRVGIKPGSRSEDAVLESITFRTDVQMAALALPELEAGPNAIEYHDDTPGPRRVRITHDWVERTAWARPAAPKLSAPADGSTVEGTRVTFKWEPPAHPKGAKIVDYQVQLCERRDMRWVFSPNFDKLVSYTPSRGKAEWTVPGVGLLNPNTPYYWRVRAKDANGVWGPWSAAWAVQCDAPGVPLNVKAAADPAAGTVRLTWTPNPDGARPVAFKVYASDEKGFTPSDTPYLVRMGRGFCKSMEEFEARTKYSEYVKTPPDLMGTTAECQLPMVGPELTAANANKAHYRVVAVDARGIESGCSDYAEAPRPFIYTQPNTRATAGKPWAYGPASLLSIGDLRCRRSKKSSYNRAFWDREELTWSLAKAPKWLTIDKATGRVAGTPGAAAVGEHAVTVRVVNNKGKSAEQSFDLRVVNP